MTQTLSQNIAKPKQVGRFTAVKGHVKIRRRVQVTAETGPSDAWVEESPKAGAPLFLFDAIFTEKGRATIEFHGAKNQQSDKQTRLTLHGESAAYASRFGQGEDQALRVLWLILLHGKVQLSTDGQDETSTVVVQAGSSTIRVTGTDFTADYWPQRDWLEVAVREGEVRVTSPPYTPFIVSRNQTAVFASGLLKTQRK